MVVELAIIPEQKIKVCGKAIGRKSKLTYGHDQFKCPYFPDQECVADKLIKYMQPLAIARSARANNIANLTLY